MDNEPRLTTQQYKMKSIFKNCYNAYFFELGPSVRKKVPSNIDQNILTRRKHVMNGYGFRENE